MLIKNDMKGFRGLNCFAWRLVPTSWPYKTALDLSGSFIQIKVKYINKFNDKCCGSI